MRALSVNESCGEATRVYQALTARERLVGITKGGKAWVLAVGVVVSFSVVFSLGITIGTPRFIPAEERPNPGQFLKAWEERANVAIQTTGINEMETKDLVLAGTVLQIENVAYSVDRVISALCMPAWALAGAVISALLGFVLSKIKTTAKTKTS
jgi:hypothetical protein